MTWPSQPRQVCGRPQVNLGLVAGLIAMVYTWTTVEQIKVLTRLCDRQRQELEKLTVVYQEKVVPALIEVNSTLLRLHRSEEPT